jgi:hypothetical protein
MRSGRIILILGLKVRFGGILMMGVVMGCQGEGCRELGGTWWRDGMGEHVDGQGCSFMPTFIIAEDSLKGNIKCKGINMYVVIGESVLFFLRTIYF